ncbi:MAG: hypothetical protein ABFC80_02925 [Coriobacteriales bacterium]
MSDPLLQPTAPAQPPQQSLSDRILAAPDKLWKRIRAALKAPSREAAAQMASQDPDIASRIEAILAGDVLGGEKKRPQTMLGQKPAAKQSPADALFGGGGISL